MLFRFGTITLFYSSLLAYLGVAMLWKPAFVIDSGLSALIGAAMDLKPLVSNENNQPALAFMGILFLVLSLMHTVAYLQHNVLYFSAMIPFRAIFDFIFTAFVYIKKEHVLSNNVTFTFAFCDLMWQFWLYASLNEDKAKFAKQMRKEAEAEKNKQMTE
ncbi:fungal protein [Schizosaccharomyces cryophilus OY26]|uniref:Fungal protein n=1 Tax=Schizosaccharomyces cryophilus (strain OY26 / ATCC MYA-4695 / CBS 11777 / NBRC 106824 / NRRL Y48691) TaxID=653667 RepID=S9VQY5_SCHCR|nr:uncharacterized protein SPOG_01093 [Schizosaccharomyces cryophilus OY26]EPY50333.1 fungal protein [Schizosaccharomyces cryophilus OY26]